MEKKMVSIITPCYNGGKLLSRYLDSVLKQTYKNIELIIVNDGSSDNTEKIVISYKGQFKKEGMKLVYIYQDNKGLGGAINTGLKHFTGDYLCWADYDDFFRDDSVEKRVNFLENNPQYGCVTSDANVYNEDDLENPIYKITDKFKYNEDEYQFEHHLKSESIFCCGCHMVRTEAFLDVNPDRDIFEGRRGQNWQMLLPVYYKYKRGFLDEPLYNYIIYQHSMSNGDNTKEKYIQRYNEHLEIIKNTLQRIDMEEDERKKYLDIFLTIYIRDRFDIGLKYDELGDAFKYYIKIVKRGDLRKYDTKSVVKLLLKRVFRIRRK